MGLFRRRKKAMVLGGSPTKPQRSRWLSRLRVAGTVLAALSVVVIGVCHDERESAKRAVLLDIEQIARASRHFRQDVGRCPHDLGELVHPPAGGIPYLVREPVDPWGLPYFFQCPGRWGESEVDVASMGPDGSWFGGDDITTDL